ncbi:MAG: F0F1 ATP synthase subunit alpha, partial [Actinomycetota bacterium]
DRPTTVISISEGLLYLDTALIFSGVRPALNAGISVSRVGGNAQVKGMKKVAGPLRLNLAQFRELEAFAEFGSELDAASQSQLERGRRVVEALKQRQFAPVPIDEQIVQIYAVTRGMLDKIDAARTNEFSAGLVDYLNTRHSDLMEHIRTTGDLPDTAALDAAIEAFAAGFGGE